MKLIAGAGTEIGAYRGKKDGGGRQGGGGEGGGVLERVGMGGPR